MGDGDGLEHWLCEGPLVSWERRSLAGTGQPHDIELSPDRPEPGHALVDRPDQLAVQLGIRG